MKNGSRHAAQARADIDTPLGTLTAVATARGLAALGFDARPRVAHALADAAEDPAHPHLAAARRWLQAYWAGDDTAAIEVALDLQGTPFQHAVWRQLLHVPRGCTRSYGELATALGSPTLARAVGRACGANPVVLIVPCHRVVGAKGQLTGFVAGLRRKTRLLQHEGARSV